MTFALRPIRTEAQYAAALAELARLWTAASGTPDADRRDLLATLLGQYEDCHAPIDPPDPVEAIRFYIDQGRLTQAELARLLGSRARASEILARRRRLTVEMIWRLHTAVGIPLRSLARPYRLPPRRAAAESRGQPAAAPAAT